MSIQTQEFSSPEIYSFPIAETQDERFGFARDKVISSLLGRFGGHYDGEMPVVVTEPTGNEYSMVVDSYARQVSEAVRENPEAGYVIYASEKEYRMAALSQGVPVLNMDTWADFPYATQEEFEAEYADHKKWFESDADAASAFAYVTSMRAVRREDEFLNKVAGQLAEVAPDVDITDTKNDESRVIERRFALFGFRVLKAARLVVYP